MYRLLGPLLLLFLLQINIRAIYQSSKAAESIEDKQTDIQFL